MIRTRIKRISLELDEQINSLALKNNIRYTDASRELAKLSKDFKIGKNKIFKEIKW